MFRAQRPQILHRTWLFASLALSALLLAGCETLTNLTMRGEPTLVLAVDEIIPADWRTLGNLVNINIDGDADVEQLFFYNYDNDPNDLTVTGKGPVGASIYDILSNANYVTGSSPREYYPIPNQPSGFYVPYRIAPNYWEPAISRSTLTSADSRRSFPHFIALPATQAADIRTQQVARFLPEGFDLSALTDRVDQEPAQELIIRGDDTHITVVWWKNAFDGYGVAHLHAPYGFIDENGGGGVIGSNPIQSIVGAFPENDRSRFCRRLLYNRVLEQDAAAHEPSPLAIRYATEELGLFFCDEVPVHPFYPEGVVLAYLRDPIGRADLVLSPFGGKFDTETLQARLSEFAQLDEVTRVDGIYTRVGLPHLNHQETQGAQNLGRVQSGPNLAWQTNVCVELIDNGAQTARQLRFRLHHQPPSLDSKQTDRWYIMDLVPVNEVGDGFSCREFIQKRPPASK